MHFAFKFQQQFKMGATSCWQPELGFNQKKFSSGTPWSNSIIFRATIVNPPNCTNKLLLVLLPDQKMEQKTLDTKKDISQYKCTCRKLAEKL